MKKLLKVLATSLLLVGLAACDGGNTEPHYEPDPTPGPTPGPDPTPTPGPDPQPQDPQWRVDAEAFLDGLLLSYEGLDLSELDELDLKFSVESDDEGQYGVLTTDDYESASGAFELFYYLTDSENWHCVDFLSNEGWYDASYSMLMRTSFNDQGKYIAAEAHMEAGYDDEFNEYASFKACFYLNQGLTATQVADAFNKVIGEGYYDEEELVTKGYGFDVELPESLFTNIGEFFLIDYETENEAIYCLEELATLLDFEMTEPELDDEGFYYYVGSYWGSTGEENELLDAIEDVVSTGIENGILPEDLALDGEVETVEDEEGEYLQATYYSDSTSLELMVKSYYESYMAENDYVDVVVYGNVYGGEYFTSVSLTADPNADAIDSVIGGFEAIHFDVDETFVRDFGYFAIPENTTSYEELIPWFNFMDLGSDYNLFTLALTAAPEQVNMVSTAAEFLEEAAVSLGNLTVKAWYEEGDDGELLFYFYDLTASKDQDGYPVTGVNCKAIISELTEANGWEVMYAEKDSSYAVAQSKEVVLGETEIDASHLCIAVEYDTSNYSGMTYVTIYMEQDVDASVANAFAAVKEAEELTDALIATVPAFNDLRYSVASFNVNSLSQDPASFTLDFTVATAANSDQAKTEIADLFVAEKWDKTEDKGVITFVSKNAESAKIQVEVYAQDGHVYAEFTAVHVVALA